MDLMSTPGAGIGREIASGERAEAELSAFIARRDTQRRRDEGERLEEDLWRASERRQEALRREEEDRGRLAICRHLEGVYARRSEEYRRRGDAIEGREATTDQRRTA